MRIETGALAAGTMLPPESALTEEYRASRGTIRQAVAALRSEGLVSTERGRGTFVRAAAIGDIVELLRQSVETTPSALAVDEEIAQIFGTKAGAELVRRQFLASDGTRVVAVLNLYYAPAKRVP
ncbi:GntR family transcriptional regulator [Micromonospora echinospora]